MNYAAARLASVKPSASAVVSERAKSLKAAGHEVIDLGLGEPDFDTPNHIIEAAFVAARSGQTRYPPTAGTAELRTAVAAKLKRDNALEYDNDEIIISNGAKQIIFAALMASMELGQEVILCAPYFGSYKDIVQIQGYSYATSKSLFYRTKSTSTFYSTAFVMQRSPLPALSYVIERSPSMVYQKLMP